MFYRSSFLNVKSLFGRKAVSRVLAHSIVILPFGTTLMNENKIEIAFPTEQEAMEYIRELEGTGSENNSE